MEFISIIHTEQPNTEAVMYNVFEDVKLDSLLGENVLRVMQYLPCERDILLRQEMFRTFLDIGTKELEALCTELRELGEVYKVYTEAVSEEHRDYVFAALLYRICVFYESCSRICCTAGFLSEFKDFFSSLYDADIRQAAERMYNKLSRELSIEIRQGSLIFKKDNKEGYASILSSCAREMGIELKAPGFIKKKLSADFINSIAGLYPQLWRELRALWEKYKDYPDIGLLAYIDQFEFYIQNTALAREYSSHGIPVCYSSITDSPSLRLNECYDITLMSKKCYDIIPNDIRFDMEEPLFFLSGANGGGKTTYLRTCAISVLMSLNGCPVPAVSSRLCMLDSVFTHFPGDERFDFDGRLADEEKRVEQILERMGGRSLVLLNETYATTNEQKASEMTCALANRLKDAGQFGVYVTHQKIKSKTDIPMLC